MTAPRPRVISRPGQSLHNTLTLTTCYRCDTRILACTVGGIDRHLDLAPVTEAGELAALLAGRRTYDLFRDWVGVRGTHNIRAGRHQPVLRRHDCTHMPAEHIDGEHLQVVVDLIQWLTRGVDAALPAHPPF